MRVDDRLIDIQPTFNQKLVPLYWRYKRVDYSKESRISNFRALDWKIATSSQLIRKKRKTISYS